jgi:hypothetical protein
MRGSFDIRKTGPRAASFKPHGEFCSLAAAPSALAPGCLYHKRRARPPAQTSAHPRTRIGCALPRPACPWRCVYSRAAKSRKCAVVVRSLLPVSLAPAVRTAVPTRGVRACQIAINLIAIRKALWWEGVCQSSSPLEKTTNLYSLLRLRTLRDDGLAAFFFHCVRV